MAQAAESSTAAQSTAAELMQTLEELNALNKWFSEAEAKRTGLIVQIQAQDKEIADINRAVTIANNNVQLTEKELASLKKTNAKLEQSRLTQATRIGEHIAAAYRLTGQDFLKQLLNQQSPDEFERMIRYHRYFSESRLDVLKQYQATLLELEKSNAQLLTQQQKQTEEQKLLVAEQSKLKNQRQQRAQVIGALDAEKETKSERFQRLQADKNRLEQLLAELRRRANELDGTAFAKARGSLVMPVAGRVRHAYGAQRADGRLRWHGIEIAANQGTPTNAVYRGRVIFSDWLRGFGFLTILDHGSGYMTLYGHADTLYKKEGDWVESGEVIATAGNSGGNNQPGIYFEVRHKGKPQDPITWINR